MASNRACVLPLLLLAVAALLLEQIALSSADFPLGGQATVHLPPAPCWPGFAARAVVLDAQGHRQPAFVAAVSAAEAGAGRCTCSLVVLLGSVKVWASDHLEKFMPAAALCRLELTVDGQLRLTDGAGKVGWLSGTAGQGVKALRLDRKTGNLVLVDAQNCTRWQSLDDPTDTFLRGQQRSLPVYLIAPMTKVASSSVFYSFELDGDKIATYVNFGETRYSYWELAPPANRTMASARLNGSGLRMLDLQGVTVAQITPPAKKPPVSFLALGDDGNLVMYYYDTQHQKFRASYQALGFCELPLSCSVHEVCTSAGKCKDFSEYADRPRARAGGGNASSNPCEGADGKACLVHLRGVTTVLRTASPLTNVTLRECVVQCARNLSCNAALYVKDDAGVVAAADDHGVCSHYTLTAGAREVTDDDGSRRYSYWVKFPAAGGRDEDDDDDGSPGTLSTSTILVICGAIDVVCALVFVVLVALYFRRLRKLAAVVDRVVELQEGEAEGVGEQNNTNSMGPNTTD